MLDKKNQRKEVRNGLKDVWNAFMCNGAKYTNNDIPYCPTIMTEIPSKIITWEEARSIHKKMIKKDKDYYLDFFVCFYIDDYKFEGTRSGIWTNPKDAYNILKHFKGIITPDFSTYQDFPYPLKIYNTFRMRAFGYWIGKLGIEVINNVRWGTPETYSYCFDGIEHNSVIAIGTVGGSPRKHCDRSRFDNGLKEMVKVLSPHIILVYGSANYPCFTELRNQGIQIISYKSKTSLNFDKQKENEHE